MSIIQNIIIVIYGFRAFLCLLKGWRETVIKNNPYGLTDHFAWLGMFVWGDAVVLGLFWFLATLVTLLLQDFLLFLLVISCFWLVRSLGETIYWLNEQFASTKRNPSDTLRGHRFFKQDSIWFIYQVSWQCITVISLITTIYLSHLWLGGI